MARLGDDGFGDGIDDALVGSKVGSDDGVADESFVVMLFLTKVGSSDGDPLADGSGAWSRCVKYFSRTKSQVQAGPC